MENINTNSVNWQMFRIVFSSGRVFRSLMTGFIFLFSLIGSNAVAQVCCPDFVLKDAVEICVSDFACRGGTAGGQGHAMAACKFSAHTYTVYPNTAPYTYSWTVTGGTPSSPTGNPVTILWGSGSTGYITVVINGGGCHDSITQQICLVDGPQANFTAVPNPVCAGSPVTFSNTSAGGSSYLWDFGDGTTSTLANPPPHSYATPGFYTVILTAIDNGPNKGTPDQRVPCGCTDTASMVIQVLSGAGPVIDTDCCYGTVCPGDTSSFCTPVVCTTYNWSVAGGVIVSGAGTNCIQVKWNAVYTVPTTVSLSVPGCAAAPCPGTTTLNVPVLYPNLPINGPNPLCVGFSGSFFLPSMPGTFYQWTTTAPPGSYSFNDADRNVANANLTFNQPGTFQVQCNYNNPMAGCSGSSSFTVNVLPVYSIFASDVICQGSTETFSGSGPATWSVTGPGSVSISPLFGNPTNITFNTPGTYTVAATPPPGIYCNLNAIKIIKVVAVPILNSISGPTLACPGKNLTFSVTSNTTGSPFNWSVISGSGTVQTQFGPDQGMAIIKMNSGPSITISVVQQIEISPGVFCTSLPQTLVVNAYGPPVISPAGPLSVCVDDITNFSATGPAPVTWTVVPPNRGSVISGQGTNNVQIRWHGPPTSATVFASHCGGSSPVAVTIMNPPATPVISANGPLIYCLPNLPAPGFTLSVPAVYTSYQWYGTSGLITGATNNTYTPGSFPPGGGSFIYSVVVSNGICTATANVQILIGNCGGGGTPPNPINCAIDFTINPNPVCENQPATFTAQQVPLSNPDPGFSYQWAFGDGSTSFQSPTQHTYLSAGLYNVTLTATLGGCTTTMVHQVTVNPTPICPITASDTMYCPGSTVILYGCGGQSSYQWYKDGLAISGATNANYNAGLYGDYWVEVTNNFGCTNTSNSIFVYEKPLPVARITGDGNVCAYPGGVAQFNLSAFYNMNYSYAWSSNPPGATFTPNNSNGAFFTFVNLTLPPTLPYVCSFIVTVTDTVTGCVNYDTLCITFNETPPLSFAFYFGCEGIPVTLAPTTPPANPGLYHYQWSNGKTTPTITVSQAGSYSLTITNKITGCSATALAAMINPKPDMSLLPRGCRTICDTDSIRMYIPLPLNWLPPFNTYASAYPSIDWYANGNYVTPIGSGPSFYYTPAVPGNYQISVIVSTAFGCVDTAGVFCLTVVNCPIYDGLDWGDAPDNPANPADYPTLLASNGARHNIVPGVMLGALVDAEPDGQPGVGADCDDNDCVFVSLGDDEDGVTIPSLIKIGMTINISVQASVNGFLDAWVDYDLDGTWATAGEHIFSNQPLTAGANALSFTVPGTASIGQSYARFRFRTTTAPINFDGFVSNGEVEDYPVFIDECSQGTELDFGDAPDMPPVGFNYPTLLANNGARHIKYLNIRLGALIDAENDGQPNTPATGDDMSSLGDEDGVQFVGTMYVGLPAIVKVTASINGFLNAWMDFNKDGDWADGGEQIFTNQPLTAGVNNLTFTIPTNALQGKTYARFRFNTLGGVSYAGIALNGEVEDYRVQTCPHWWPIHTAIKHYITIPHDLQNLYPGDVLGVFYQDAAGMLACGGLSEFNGTDDQLMVAYGDNPSTQEKDGFAIGEPIIWKLCSIIKGDANPVDVVYDFTYPSHNGLFAQNGLSALSEIIGLHVIAEANPGTICMGEPVQLTANAGGAEGVAFSWTSQPAGFVSELQNPVDHPAVNTTYYLEAYDGVFHAYDTVEVTVTQYNPLVETLPLRNLTIPSGQANCFNALYTITTGGDGTNFTVESGAMVQMIAGQTIRFLPGTRSMHGSHLHAIIAPDGPYCCDNTPPPAPSRAEGQDEQPAVGSQDQFFKVYPNPTTGVFTLELSRADETDIVNVEIYGILGEKILSRQLHGENRRVFDLSGNKPGVYLMRVMSGNEAGMAKIIRQ